MIKLWLWVLGEDHRGKVPVTSHSISVSLTVDIHFARVSKVVMVVVK